MANDVFANGREISCKAAAGKTICAMPDVCFTPPENPATPPGVPVPYPNTGMASDTTNGSKKVKISGKECGQKNKSYFRKSMGDEAGCAAKKGIVTSQNRGKVYFNSWSMDVKIEGENAVRHLDITTNNHASFPGDTPTWPYLDSQAMTSDHPCAKEKGNERARCAAVEKKIAEADIPERSRNKAMREAYCEDQECKEARKCMLQPYDPALSGGQMGCCDNKTGHHGIPVHCFMPPGTRAAAGSERYSGCEGYEAGKAPCVCVEGAGKEKEHGDIHELCDMLEDMNMNNGTAGSWSYENASTAGAMSINEVTGCDEGCIKAQLDAYHQQKAGSPNIANDTALRADSMGTRTPEGFTPSVTPEGSASASF